MPRQEEIQNVTTPIQIVLFATYFVSFQAVSEPDGGLAQVLSFVPPTAAIVLPVRIIAGDVPAWEVVAGTILLAAGAAALLLAALADLRERGAADGLARAAHRGLAGALAEIDLHVVAACFAAARAAFVGPPSTATPPGPDSTWYSAQVPVSHISVPPV